MRHVYNGVAHPWLCDALGHMTTRHYVAMFDDASYHFLNQVFGIDWATDKLSFADVKHVIEYRDEVAAGQLLRINAHVASVGNKSLTVRYEMYNISKEALAATLDSTSVLFNLETRKAEALSESMRSAAQSNSVKEPG